MEEKRRYATPHLPSTANSLLSEPSTTRRRGAGQKRKSKALNASNSSLHPPPLHNGPLTRARQTPTNFSSAATASSAAASYAPAPAVVKHSESAAQKQGSGGDLVVVAEEFKESELESVEAAIEAEFEAIRSRGNNVHVVPTHCGWFSWTDIHPIEKWALPSFFNGQTENRTPDAYKLIRNWIIKRIHANPNIKFELKDLSELNVGDLNARQAVMELLDYWGLINFHPFPAMGSVVASASDDGDLENNFLLEKLYHFETLQLCQHVVVKPSLMTPAMTSGLFPESTITEELVKQEEPAVEMLEYHCNSCAADCSRKRYHCQKQADFDLCTDCFSDRRFGSGMSSLDFILMEPAEAAAVSGGKWTDQETLLLLEALELYKENWNEIAQHVATKSKAQCILHFVQMPIEDAFIDSDDNLDISSKETADPTATNNDSSLQKCASENAENNANDSIEGHDETSKAEDVKAKVNPETPKLEDGNDEKPGEGTSKSEDTVKVKCDQEGGNDCALNALKEAFAAVGYSPGPEGPSSFAEVGNPVMALASFLAHVVSSDVAVASTHSFLKSKSGNSHGTELAARHCFLLEDLPDDRKGTASSEWDSKNEGEQGDENVKQDKPMLGGKDSPNDHNMEIDNNVLEDNRQLDSMDDGALEKTISSKEQAMINHKALELDQCKDLNHSKLANNQAPNTPHDSGGSTTKDDILPSSKELQERTLIKEPCNPVGELKDGHGSNSLLSENHPQPVETLKDYEMTDSMPLDKSQPQKLLSTNPTQESLETADSEMDVDMVSHSLPSEKSDSQPIRTAISSKLNGIEKDADMMSLSHPDRPNSEAVAGEDDAENGTTGKDGSTKTKHDNNFEKLKHAAVSTLAAAAVKAKVLENQEEDEIRQLTSLLIERQLHKLEAKIAFFNDVENLVMRARDHLERSRHKLYHERALIIASRLGLPPSSSRGVPPSLPTHRIPMNFANSFPRSQSVMNPQMPVIPRSMGTSASTIANPLASATAVGRSVLPSSQ